MSDMISKRLNGLSCEKGKSKILISNGLLPLPASLIPVDSQSFDEQLVTVLRNFMYYGYIPSIEAQKRIQGMDSIQLASWWSEIEPVLDKLTGKCKEATGHIVYKNFPEEVLDKSEAEYWWSQILIYLGVPVDFVREEQRERPKLTQELNYKVLQPESESSLSEIAKNLYQQSTKWVDSQLEAAVWLYGHNIVERPDLAELPFRENAILLAKSDYDAGALPELNKSLDVMRFAAVLSGVSIRVSANTRFKNFSRKERRMFLLLLEDCADLAVVAANNKALFKKFIARLHPYEGAIACPNVVAVHDMLYSGAGLESTNAQYLRALEEKDASVMSELSKRPAVFMRKLTELYAAFGKRSLEQFSNLLTQLTTMQLLEIKVYLRTHNERTYTVGFPNSSWNRPTALPVKEGRVKFNEGDLEFVTASIDAELERRVQVKYPDGVRLGKDLHNIYLPTNDIQLAPFGRGTRFPIPENTNVIRTNTFWKMKVSKGRDVWFDNGWSMFDESFEPVSLMDWNSVRRARMFGDKKLQKGEDVGAIFSGDPCSDTAGTQVIDLNISQMADNGIKFAVWTTLSFSRIPFSEAGEVYAGMQFVQGETEGGILEPSRCQLMFDIKSQSLSTMLCVLDVENREVIYLDAPCSMNVTEVFRNLGYISSIVPPVLEYIDSKPTLADMFKESVQDTPDSDSDSNPVSILFNDADVELSKGSAFVLKPTNEKNTYKSLSIQDLLHWGEALVADSDEG